VGRATVTPSLQALLTGLIDYAGLFPPASLPMAEAVARYARYRRGPHAWMLGRFIVSRQRLTEFASLAEDAGEWRLSVLASDDVAADANEIEAFNARRHAVIDTVEAKVAAAAEVRRVAGMLPQALQLWFEVAPGEGAAFDAMLQAIADLGGRAGAKLRTGGVTPEAIPAADLVARFLIACARAGVICKATAGLHHPVRAPHRLTYADDSATALMHGFVNVFLAAALARQGADREVLIALLEERDARHIAWHDDHVTWKGHRLDAAALIASRAVFARSFGSCSFDEPVDDLHRLGWLP
jgi:hypothetical protein